MKIQYASDLHFELIADPTFIGLEPALGADVLILAGDIAVGTRALERFKDWPVPVIYVHGNHELYGCEDIGRDIAELRDACAAAGVHFLEKDAVVIDGIRFLGTALWTDYSLDGEQEDAMIFANVFMSDMKAIRSQGSITTPIHYLHRHKTSRLWLEAQLLEPHDGPTVVVTHHAPHARSLPASFTGTKKHLRPAYASDMTSIMEQRCAPDVWIHGHVHTTSDYVVGHTRVLANPRGYLSSKFGPENKVFQNEQFDPVKTVVV